VAVVLLIACANVAHLLLARASRRREEFRIRVALGASVRDLVGQLLIEGLVLASLACGLGLVSAYWAKGVVTTLAPRNLRANLDFSFDERVILFTVGVSALTTAIFALGPAWRVVRRPGTVHSEATETRVSGSRRSVHGMLVVCEICLAVVALVTAGLFIRSLQFAQQKDFGFDLEQQVVTSVDLGSLRYPLPRIQTFYDAVIERLRGLPGVAGWLSATLRP
jgi:hypothetical protein